MRVNFGSVVEFVRDKKESLPSDLESYVSTENMVENFGGIVKPASIPMSGKVTAFRPGDVLFSNIRTYFRKVWQADRAGTCSNDVLVFRPKNSQQITSDYIFHICRWDHFTQYTVRTSNGVKMPRGDKEAIKNFQFDLPSLEQQNCISSVLAPMDSKIELNRRMNRTLEATAQAIFKDWFVDFGPTRAKMEGRKPYLAPEIWDLFPDKLDNKSVPEGWKSAKIGDYLTCLDSKRIPLSGKERTQRHGKYPYYGATGIIDNVDDYIFDGTFLLVGEDGSVERPDGTAFIQYVSGKIWVNNHAHVLVGAGGISTEFLFLAFQFVKVAPYITGAVQLKITQKNLRSIPFLYPGKGVLDNFQRIVSSGFETRLHLEEENRILRELLSIALPKLISGKEPHTNKVLRC